MRKDLTHLLVLDPGRLDGNPPLREVLSPAAAPSTVLDPLDARWPSGPRSRAAAIAAAAAPEVTRPCTVVAHCTNTALAYEVAAALRGLGTPVAGVVAFAPVHIDPAGVRAHGARLLEALGRPAGTAWREADLEWSASPARSLTTLLARLRGAALENAAEAGLDGDEAQEFADMLCGRYGLWMGHLAQHLGVEVTSPGCMVHVVDADPDSGTATARRIATVDQLRVWSEPDPLAFAGSRLRERMMTLSTFGAFQ